MTPQDSSAETTTVTIGGRTIELGSPIDETLRIGELLLVRLDLYDLPPDDPMKGRNVLALDKNGEEVWRIEPFWHKVKAKDGSRDIPDSYIGFDLGEDGKLYAYQGIGYICEIDLKSGKILHEEQTR